MMNSPLKISDKPLVAYKISKPVQRPSPSGEGFVLQETKKNLIFFHGYGANAFDLMSLASEFQFNFEAEFYFPNGCCDLPPEFGGGLGRAWFQIPVSHMQKMMMQGQALDLRNLDPEGIKEATDLAVEWIQKMGFQMKDLILGGFSQGAMVALEVALALPETCSSVILFSSTLIKEKQLRIQIQKKPDLRVFQSHGEGDGVLPFYLAQELHKVLIESGVHAQFHSFRGGHEIPLEVLKKAEKFLH